MVEYNEQALDATFAALADPTRRAILARLSNGDLTVTEIAQPFAMSLAAVSKHLNVLNKANLISRRKDGRVRHCRLLPENLNAAADWVKFYQQFWDENLDALARYLDQNSDQTDQKEREKT